MIRFLAKTTTEKNYHGSFLSVADLRQVIARYNADYNQSPKPFKWIASADVIHDKTQNLSHRLVQYQTGPAYAAHAQTCAMFSLARPTTFLKKSLP
jgi:hypothetical protein